MLNCHECIVPSHCRLLKIAYFIYHNLIMIWALLHVHVMTCFFPHYKKSFQLLSRQLEVKMLHNIIIYL